MDRRKRLRSAREKMSAWQNDDHSTDGFCGTAARVLIVRIGAMGDVLHAMPAVAALREAHPEWFIGWVVEPRWKPLLQAMRAEAWRTCPGGSGLSGVPRRSGSNGHSRGGHLREIAALRRELRREKFDLCVDMQGSMRSAVIGRMAGARRFVGSCGSSRGSGCDGFMSERVRVGGGACHRARMRVAGCGSG